MIKSSDRDIDLHIFSSDDNTLSMFVRMHTGFSDFKSVGKFVTIGEMEEFFRGVDSIYKGAELDYEIQFREGTLFIGVYRYENSDLVNFSLSFDIYDKGSKDEQIMDTEMTLAELRVLTDSLKLEYKNALRGKIALKKYNVVYVAYIDDNTRAADYLSLQKCVTDLAVNENDLVVVYDKPTLRIGIAKKIEIVDKMSYEGDIGDLPKVAVAGDVSSDSGRNICNEMYLKQLSVNEHSLIFARDSVLDNVKKQEYEAKLEFLNDFDIKEHRINYLSYLDNGSEVESQKENYGVRLCAFGVEKTTKKDYYIDMVARFVPQFDLVFSVTKVEDIELMICAENINTITNISSKIKKDKNNE